MKIKLDIGYTLRYEYEEDKIKYLLGLGFTPHGDSRERIEMQVGEIHLEGCEVEGSTDLLDELCRKFKTVEYDGDTLWVGGK